MVLPDKRPERKETDESLRTEREKTDQALRATKEKLETNADLVVLRARENADAVLTKARAKADEKVSGPAPHHLPSTRVAASRVREDRVLQKERDAADKTISKERTEVTQVLRKLMPLEREATDRTLLTERVRSDNALENRDDFLGMVCHDLRSLLSGIVMEAELLLQEATDHDSGKFISSSAAQIQHYGARMNRLIGDLIDVVSIDSGKLSMMPSSGDTIQLISEVAETFRATAAVKEITVDVAGGHGSLVTNFDHDRMFQVITNLLTNAIKFTPKGGKINISCEATNGEVLISVCDTGVGIPADMLEAVFERFTQVGKNDARGLGLGLYISRSIIAAHRGKIWVESNIGEGSQFYFTLPMVSPKDI